MLNKSTIATILATTLLGLIKSNSGSKYRSLKLPNIPPDLIHKAKELSDKILERFYSGEISIKEAHNLITHGRSLGTKSPMEDDYLLTYTVKQPNYPDFHVQIFYLGDPFIKLYRMVSPLSGLHTAKALVKSVFGINGWVAEPNDFFFKFKGDKTEENIKKNFYENLKWLSENINDFNIDELKEMFNSFPAGEFTSSIHEGIGVTNYYKLPENEEVERSYVGGPIRHEIRHHMDKELTKMFGKNKHSIDNSMPLWAYEEDIIKNEKKIQKLLSRKKVLQERLKEQSGQRNTQKIKGKISTIDKKINLIEKSISYSKEYLNATRYESHPQKSSEFQTYLGDIHDEILYSKKIRNKDLSFKDTPDKDFWMYLCVMFHPKNYNIKQDFTMEVILESFLVKFSFFYLVFSSKEDQFISKNYFKRMRLYLLKEAYSTAKTIYDHYKKTIPCIVDEEFIRKSISESHDVKANADSYISRVTSKERASDFDEIFELAKREM